MKNILKKFFPLMSIILIVSLSQGCRSEGPEKVLPRRVKNSERNAEAIVLDRALMPSWWEKVWDEGNLSFENSQFSAICNDRAMSIQSEIRNRLIDKDMEIEVSVSFRSGGNIVDETVWEKFKLTPNQAIAYKTNSVCPADSYCVRIRFPRKNTNSINGPGINLMADKMLRSLYRSPVVYDADKPPVIALHQFNNRSNEKIDESLFPAKLRVELNSRANNPVKFVDREYDVKDAVETERRSKRENLLSDNKIGTREKLTGVNYFLTGDLRNISDYWHITFRLTSAESTEIDWEDQFEFGNY